MTREPGPGVFDVARRIPGIGGVELQVHFRATTLWDGETLLSYKNAAEKAGLLIPSLAGIWPKGAGLLQPASVEETLRKSIRAAEALNAKVILVSALGKNCPDMEQESSYGPAVAAFQKIAGAASDAGVVLGLETALSPAQDKKLVDLIARPSVRVYYDADNCERFGHAGQSIPGYALLGSSRIAQIHLKNESRLLEEPGRVNWADALKAIHRIGYNGWLVFETSHTSPEQCIAATKENIAFIRRELA